MSIFNINKKQAKTLFIIFLILTLWLSYIYYVVNHCYEIGGIYTFYRNGGCCNTPYKIKQSDLLYYDSLPLICKNHRPISINLTTVNKTYWRNNVFID
jgi:hypothetical protein